MDLLFNYINGSSVDITGIAYFNNMRWYLIFKKIISIFESTEKYWWTEVSKFINCKKKK